MKDKCICTFREKMVGDGCEFCNPEMAAYYDEQARLDEEEDES